MKAVNSIHDRGGKVTELVSLCGGLPDPVAAENPFKYKISWSPRGVLSAATNRSISLITVTLKGLLNLVVLSSNFLYLSALVPCKSTIPDK
jgi:Saccharopine dehydrogenase C-terminal domain